MFEFLILHEPRQGKEYKQVQWVQVTVVCAVWQGKAMLLAYGAYLTQGNHSSVRIELELDCELVLQHLFQSLLGDMSTTMMQQISVYITLEQSES